MDTAAPLAPLGRTALRYRVGGMDCPSCAAKIETALGRMGGAEGILVNYHSQTLTLRLDEAATPRTAVEARIRSLGYDVGALGDPVYASTRAIDAEGHPNAAPAPPWWRSRKLRPLLAIGGLLAIGALAGGAALGIGGWAELPAALLGLCWAGRRAFVLARVGSPFSIEMLMSVAALGALFIGAPAEAAVVVFLFTAGEAMEGFAAGQARAGIAALTALVPRMALLLEGEALRQVPAAMVQVGQTVLSDRATACRWTGL